ncbi:hypothetical protein QW180_02710 [Vibrio sinaloensis]|nr:hypothetical protein [Vibrio sinaloensis]
MSLCKNELSPEQERAMREGLDEESLAVFDLLKKPSLTVDEEKKRLRKLPLKH